MRRKIVAGNWKMNNTFDEGLALASEVINMIGDEGPNDVTTVLIPPFIHLSGVSSLLGGQQRVFLGAQNCNDHESGAFTGETSVTMLKSVGTQFVTIGHSERREYFSETDQMLATKVNLAMSLEMTPIFCCGESLEIRDSGDHFAFVERQIEASLFHLSAEEIKKIVLAYEPIWAIGTGKTASSQQAQDMHAHLRRVLAAKYGAEIADSISILYGGSCKPSNAKELFACQDVDGGLIGGASLKSRDFVDIIKSF